MVTPHRIEAQWMGGMEFNVDVDGHTVLLDAPERSGGQDRGPIPKPLLLTALAGCTGMDVVALLRKEGRPVDSLGLRVSGELGSGHPIVYTAVHIEYDFRGPPGHREAALDAVNRSQERYCGVSHMLKRILPVSWDVIYNGETILTHSGEAARAAA